MFWWDEPYVNVWTRTYREVLQTPAFCFKRCKFSINRWYHLERSMSKTQRKCSKQVRIRQDIPHGAEYTSNIKVYVGKISVYALTISYVRVERQETWVCITIEGDPEPSGAVCAKSATTTCVFTAVASYCIRDSVAYQVANPTPPINIVVTFPSRT